MVPLHELKDRFKVSAVFSVQGTQLYIVWISKQSICLDDDDDDDDDNNPTTPLQVSFFSELPNLQDLKLSKKANLTICTIFSQV